MPSSLFKPVTANTTTQELHGILSNYASAGKSIDDIARDYGVSTQEAINNLNKAGIGTSQLQAMGLLSTSGGTWGTGGTEGSASSGSYTTTKFPDIPNPATYNPVLGTVKPEDTVQGQLNQIIDPDSPLMRRAKAAALSNMASRGLLNSSLTDTAVVSAMIDRGLPIA